MLSDNVAMRFLPLVEMTSGMNEPDVLANSLQTTSSKQIFKKKSIQTGRNQPLRLTINRKCRRL